MRMVQVMLVFSRDEWVEQNAAASSQKQFALSTQVLSDLPCILHIIFLHNLLHQHYDSEFSMQCLLQADVCALPQPTSYRQQRQRLHHSGAVLVQVTFVV